MRQDHPAELSEAVAGAPGPPDWGSRHSVVCAHCETEAVRSLVAYVAQRITRFPELRLLVPAVGALEDGGPPDLVEIAVRPGDWTLWPVCHVGNHPSGPRRVALLAAGRQWVSCSRCGAHVRLDLRELASRLPSGRALVA